MGLSLADAAVRGNLSTPTIAAQKQMLLQAGDTEGLIALNRALFGGFTMMAKEDDDTDDDADDDEDEDDDESDEDEDDDSDDDEDDKGKAKKADPKDVRIQELSAEAKKKRIRIRTQSSRIAELEAENARLKGTKKTKKDDEDEDDESDSEEFQKVKSENTSLKQTLRRQTLRSEFQDLTSGEDAEIKFKDPKIAFKLLDLDDVEIDEDGEVDGLEDAIKDLAKSAPYLLVEKKGKKDEDGEDKPKRRTGQPSGTSRRRRGNANEDALIKKYNMQR